MPRTLFRLTDRTVRNLKAPGYHADGGGLYLQISKAGTKSWVLRFRINGRTRDMGLGALANVGLTHARAHAAELRPLIARGVDPIEQARVNRAATIPTPVETPRELTFSAFAEKYIDDHAPEWRSSKHADQWRETLKKYAYPFIGDMPLAAIDTPDILRMLEPIWRTKSETASRVRGRVQRILAAAAVRGLRPANNPAAWTGHLSEALPAKRRSTPFAALPYRSIPLFMEDLSLKTGVGPAALRFTILTAARSGEVRGARWSEIDEAQRVWTVPGARMKAGRPHLVPLHDQALAVLKTMKPLRIVGDDLIFPGTRRGRALNDMTLSKLVRTMNYDATVHGFRAGFKTWAEQETDHANVVIEAALAHIVGDKAERAYMRGDWLEKRRRLMDDWGAYCMSIPVQTILPLDEDRGGLAA
jgi:integrase